MEEHVRDLAATNAGCLVSTCAYVAERPAASATRRARVGFEIERQAAEKIPCDSQSLKDGRRLHWTFACRHLQRAYV